MTMNEMHRPQGRSRLKTKKEEIGYRDGCNFEVLVMKTKSGFDV